MLLNLLKTVGGFLIGKPGGGVGISAMLVFYGAIVTYLLQTQEIKYCLSILELSGLAVLGAIVSIVIKRRNGGQ